jgi:pyrroloquinoline quinone (PQQ) biosynthesis protein C
MTPLTHAPWLETLRREVLIPRARRIATHPFVVGMEDGRVEPEKAERFFSGLMWHLMDFGKHVAHLETKRPPDVERFLEGRDEDKDGDTDVLGRIVEAFGGPRREIERSPWLYRPHEVWVRHDALLRSAIYSADLPWQVGTAALNVGIESLVPTMIEPLFKAALKNYHVSSHEAAWLESRSGEKEKQHGENGYLVLSRFVAPDDLELQAQCAFQIRALSHSMAYGLLESGL